MTTNPIPRVPFDEPFILQGPIGRGKAYRQNKVMAIQSSNNDLVTIIKMTVNGSLIHFDIPFEDVIKVGNDIYEIYNAPKKFGDCKTYLSAQNYKEIQSKLSTPYLKVK